MMRADGHPADCRRTLAMVVLLALGPATAQSLTIDSFATNQSAMTLTFPPPDTSASSSVSGGGVLGGERDLEIHLIDGSGGETPLPYGEMNAGASSGFLSYSHTFGISSAGRIEWDGTDGSPTLNPTGLGGVDLTAGGTQDALLLNFAMETQPIQLSIQVFTDAGNASTKSFALNGLILSSTNVVVPFIAFVPNLGAGADFTNVGAISLSLGAGLPFAPIVELDFIETTSALAASKTVAIVNDVDGDTIADPGDTLRYTVVVSNPDETYFETVDTAATGVAFTDASPANTALVTGSATTTQGTVNTGNGSGDTSVAVGIGTINDGASVTITFDVVIDQPLSASVTHITSQGTVTSDTLTSLLTDDPAVGGTADPTLIPVAAGAFALEIPTVGEWGLLVLMVSLAAIGFRRVSTLA